MSRKKSSTSLPPPYLRRISLIADRMAGKKGYPYDLPWLCDPEFEINFTAAVTIIVGENGTGKSTLIEAIAGLSGYDQAGGGKGYSPVDHALAIDESGTGLGDVMRAAWLPRVTNGWFFKAETFFSVARYLDAVGANADYLSHSHGEGFLRFFEERMSRQGIYFLDEPESALSPKRQLDLLRILNRIQQSQQAQVIMATHSPILMALPNAQVLEISKGGIAAIDYRQTAHFKLYQSFTDDPRGFVTEALAGE
jgi:predicted ATPase